MQFLETECKILHVDCLYLTTFIFGTICKGMNNDLSTSNRTLNINHIFGKNRMIVSPGISITIEVASMCNQSYQLYQNKELFLGGRGSGGLLRKVTKSSFHFSAKQSTPFY